MGLLGLNEGIPYAYWKWMIVERTGWSIGYIDSLSISTLHEYLQVLEGRHKYQTSLLRKK